MVEHNMTIIDGMLLVLVLVLMHKFDTIIGVTGIIITITSLVPAAAVTAAVVIAMLVATTS